MTLVHGNRGERMNDSILNDIKKLLGIMESYEHFDVDIIIHINTAFSTLTQLGIGPSDGFSITNKTETWADFIGDDYLKFQSVKTYIYLKVRMIFDPPSNSSATEAIKSTISELEWRLNINAESKEE